VVVVHNRGARLRQLATDLQTIVSGLASDYELIFVDNASTDASAAILKSLTAVNGLANLQVFVLTKEIDYDTAAWAGVESALGDLVAVVDPSTDDIHFLGTMVDASVGGADLVFADATLRPGRTGAERAVGLIFGALNRRFNGADAGDLLSRFRVLSKTVITYLLQHPRPALAYRHLGATGGFSRVDLSYLPDASRLEPWAHKSKTFGSSFEDGMRLLVSTTKGPMRVVTTLSAIGAVSNVLYSFYVVAIAIWKDHVAPGWTTLSLQQSGMFFLISMTLMILGEYIIHMASLTNEGPAFHIAQEFTSARITRLERLNVTEKSGDAVHAAGVTRRASGSP
jgi:hypothetical protein